MKNKLQITVVFIILILFLFVSCDNYLINTGIRDYIFGSVSNNYTITFNANGGTGTMEAQTFVPETSISLKANAFTNTDSSFIGWSDISGGTDAIYTDRAKVYFKESKTLYAVWHPTNDVASITFKGNGGTVPNSGDPALIAYTQYILKKTETLLITNNFTNGEKAFAGWSITENGEAEYTNGASIALEKGMTLYAQWGEAAIITFHKNDGSGITKTQTVAIGDVTLEANTYDRDSYKFQGWATAKAGEKLYDDEATISIQENINLYAVWKGVYSVTFNTNGGTLVDSLDVEEGNTFTKPTEPTKNGSFQGWYKDPTFNTPWNFNTDTVTTDITLYAKWQYTITFGANSGTGSMAQQTFIHNEEPFLTANAFSNGEQGFAGWSEIEGGSLTYTDRAKLTFNENKSLHAVWITTHATITFYGNGGTIEGANPPVTEYKQYVPNGQSLLIINNFVHQAGQGFGGWSTTADGDAEYGNGENITPTGDMTLYAIWRESATITFHKNDGSGVTKTQTVAKGNAKLEANIFAWDSHRFEGWATSESGVKEHNDGAIINIQGDMNLYADWTEFYTITFNGNNQTTGNKDPIIVDKGTPITLPKNLFVKTGHTFKGWTTAQDGTGDFYTDQKKVTFTESTTLYAKWEAHTYTITFKSNYVGGAADYTQVFAHDERIGLTPNKFTKDGYAFGGWTNTKDGTDVVYGNNAAITFNENKTLYALWVDTTTAWTITFKGNDGTVSGSPGLTEYTQSITKNTTAPLSINNFVHEDENFAFAGWATTETNAEDGIFKYENGENITPKGNIELWAVWKEAITITFHPNYGGASRISQKQVVLRGVETSLDANPFTRHQYYFNNWSDNPGGGETTYDDTENVTLHSSIDLYAQWSSAPYSDEYTKQIISNGQNLKLESDGGGSTVTWLRDGGNLTLNQVNAAYVDDGANLSEYTIVGSGKHVLAGGNIKGITGMTTVTVSGDLIVGEGTIDLDTGNQLKVGALTGNARNVVVRTFNNFGDTKIATLVDGVDFETVSAKLSVRNIANDVELQIKQDGSDIKINGALAMTPPAKIPWEGDSFTIPSVIFGKAGTIFSLYVEGGHFKIKNTTIDGATFNMGVLTDGTYVDTADDFTTGKKYTYVQFFPGVGNETFPAAGAENFIKGVKDDHGNVTTEGITFYSDDSGAGMIVKINFETVELDGVNTDINNIDQSKVTYFNGSYYQIKKFNEEHLADAERNWVNAYESAKLLSFNGLQGYLMTITSKAENNFIFDKINIPGTVTPTALNPANRARAWIGGTRQVNRHGYDAAEWDDNESYSTKWYWVVGPEAGKTFYPQKGYSSGSLPTGVDYDYNNWNNPTNTYINNGGTEVAATGAEPNNKGNGNGDKNDEFFAHYLESSLWNDFPLNAGEWAPYHYFVEFTPYVTAYGSQTPTNAPAFAQEVYIKP